MRAFAAFPVIICGLVVLLLPATHAEPVIDKLAEAKNTYQKQKNELRASALRDHISRLETLAENLETKGDKSASAVRAHIASSELEISSLLGTAPPPLVQADPPATTQPTTEPPRRKTIKLAIRDADLSGSLRLSSRYIQGWTSMRSGAVWTKRDIIPGRYEIHLDYRPVYRGGGTLEIRDLIQTAEVRIPASRGSTTKAATFDLKQSMSLQINCKTMNSNGILLLTGVRLVPVEK